MDKIQFKIHLVANDLEETTALCDHLALIENGTTFDVRQSHRLSEALEKTQSEPFDLMVLDLSLPDSKGLNTFTQVRQYTNGTPILVMVGAQDQTLALEAARKGAHDYLVKGSWSPKVLDSAIKRTVQRNKLQIELREARNALWESDQKFKAFFETTPDAVYVKDTNLQLTEVNPAMAELFNKKPEQLVGTTAEDLFGKKVGREIEQLDNRALKGESIEQEHTTIINGVPMTFLDFRVPLKNSEGKITGLCCISRNITERFSEAPYDSDDEIVYESPVMRDVMKQAARIAGTDGTVLLLGETGTGKDHLARWMHDHSKRADSSYFSLNCAALSSELAESELFGHETGAFTGARGRKRGMLELAEGGTLLLNEIGELTLPLQSKLLTFLDTRSFLRVGGVKHVNVDARIMAATHRNLEEEVAAGRFLEALYHRLNVFSLALPPLRERTEDIPQLVKALVSELAQKRQLDKVPVVDSRMLQGLAAHGWPGNVRELRNMLERAVMLWDGGQLDLNLAVEPTLCELWTQDLPFPSNWTLREVTDEVIKQMCMKALIRTKGNKKEAARILGSSRDALYRYIRKFNLEPDLID